MKMLGLSLAVLVCLFVLTGNAFGAGCVGSTGMRDDSIFYTDCFPIIGGDTSDSERLQRAVTAANGRLIFNEEVYYLDKAVNLKSWIVLQGASGIFYDPTLGTSPRLVAVVDNFNVFQIAAGVNNVSVRDLSFFYYDTVHTPQQPPTNNVAIYAYGSNSSALSSHGNEFTRLRIAGFHKGIEVATGGDHGWQFDDNSLSDTTIEGCAYAIYLNAFNTGWLMHNIDIASAADAFGIYIERGGYITLDLIVGNGSRDKSGNPASDTFLYAATHGPLNIRGSSFEAFKTGINIDGVQGNKQHPITVVGNAFPACYDAAHDTSMVIYKNTTVASQGNNYTCSPSIARPQILGLADVSSTDDKFCNDDNTGCIDGTSGLRSEWAVKSNNVVLRIDHSTDPGEWFKPVTQLWATVGYEQEVYYERPLLTLTSSFYTSGTGPAKYNYEFSRNKDNGRLEIEGDQAGTSSGYHDRVGYVFKGGPVQLQSTAQADLFKYNVSSDNGSMLYCSDCVAGSTPCAGLGGGALALKVGSAWHCK